jgi:hypothetical protein
MQAAAQLDHFTDQCPRIIDKRCAIHRHFTRSWLSTLSKENSTTQLPPVKLS